MHLYFAYGSNLSLAQIRERTDNQELKPLYTAYLPDKKLCFPRKSTLQKGGVASYEDQEKHKLWGTVFNLTGDELNKIDTKEGYKVNRNGNSYERVEIEVIKLDETRIRALTYCTNPEGAYLPSQYYMNKLIHGAEDCHLPLYYIQELRNIQTNGID